MKKSVNIVIICILIAALITGGVVYLIYQTRDDELLIGSERAEAVALRDAGLTQSQVSSLDSGIKYSCGQWYYKVTFRTIALSYRYEIDAYSGAVLEKTVK